MPQKHSHEGDQTSKETTPEEDAAIQKAGEVATGKVAEVQESSDETVGKIDDILDEIDDVLETNAEDFVKDFIQKGGQ